MMSQGVLGFQYEGEPQRSGMTGMAGLLLYLDLAEAASLGRSMQRHMRVRKGQQGWTDRQILMSLICLNLSGGDCVEDLRVLAADEGFGRVLRRVETHGLSRRERRELDGRWRREQTRSVPSPSAVFRYLSAFHDAEQEKLRIEGKAFIPAPNGALRDLMAVHQDFLSFVQSRRRESVATLDMDATLIETTKASSLYCYKSYPAYQPLNVWWAEQGILAHTEFRDGNVPAGHEQLRVLQETLERLPAGVKTVRMRSDSAGYQHALLRYCALGESERFGKIEFAVSADMSQELKRTVAEVEASAWQPLLRRFGKRTIASGQEWAEVCFVPNQIGHSQTGPVYRYLAIREPLRQQVLPGLEEQEKVATPWAVSMSEGRYKVSAIVTTLDWAGDEVIGWLRERCGKSEEAHAVMKDDLAGGKLPSGDFGANAAWWWIMALALNLNVAMKRLVLGDSWVNKRMKAIRFALIHLPARVLERARQIRVRLWAGHPSLGLLLAARTRILALAQGPAG